VDQGCGHPPGHSGVVLRTASLQGHRVLFPTLEKKSFLFYDCVCSRSCIYRAMAQLVARMAGGHEVVGSSPTSPTKILVK